MKKLHSNFFFISSNSFQCSTIFSYKHLRQLINEFFIFFIIPQHLSHPSSIISDPILFSMQFWLSVILFCAFFIALSRSSMYFFISIINFFSYSQVLASWPAVMDLEDENEPERLGSLSSENLFNLASKSFIFLPKYSFYFCNLVFFAVSLNDYKQFT